MGAIANKVLSDLGYDTSFKVGNNSGIRVGTYGQAGSRNVNTGDSFVGNVFNSIKSGVGAIANTGLGALKKSYIDEPLNYAKYVGGTVAAPFQALGIKDPGQRQEAFRQAVARAYPTIQGLSGGLLPTPAGGVNPLKGLGPYEQTLNEAKNEYNKRYYPVATTAATFLAPELKVAKEANPIIKFAGSVIGAGNQYGKTFANPILKTGARVIEPLAYKELVTNPTLESLQSLPGNVKNIATGKGTAADYLNIGSLGLPAGVTALQKGAQITKKAISAAIYDVKGSTINQLSFKGGTVSDFLENLGKKAASGDKQAAKEFDHYSRLAKVSNQHFMDEGTTAEKLIAAHTNMPLGKMTAKEFLDNQMQPLIKATKLAQANPDVLALAKSKGISADRIGVGRFDQAEKAALTRRLEAAGTREGKLAVLAADEKAGLPYTKNKLLMQDVASAALEEDPKAMRAALKKITATTTTVHAPDNMQLPKGYFSIIKPKGAAGFKSAAESADLVDNQAARFGGIGRWLEKAGLSPRATEPGAFNNALHTNFADALKGTQYEQISDSILGRVLSGMDKHPTVLDPRAFTKRELDGILGGVISNRSDVSVIQKALRQAYAKVPAEIAGLGPKAINKLTQVFPAEAKYLRAKGALSYSYNPFFQVKQLTKSALIGVAEGGNPLAKMSNETETFLRNKGYFNKYLRDAGLNDFFGNVEGVAGNSKINKLQQNLVGGLAESLARVNGKSVQQIFEEGGPLAKELDHALRVSLGYPKGGYLNSPLAKTLNVVIFPSRFNTKVLQETGKFFARQNPATQIAIVRGIANTKQWLDSPQGKDWEKQNSELIKVMKYFTPVHTFQQFADFLGSGKIADLGQVGGMPLGVLTQIMKSAGVTMPGPLEQSKHPDIETGQVYSDKVGKTAKAKLQLGLENLISSIFAYPGATIGLPSKTKVLEGAMPFLKPDKGSVEYVGGSSPSFGNNVQFAPTKFTPTQGRASTLSPIKVNPIYSAKKSKRGRVPSTPISQL